MVIHCGVNPLRRSTEETGAVIQPLRDLAVAVAANAGDEADAATSELRDTFLERFGAPDE